jgi:D-glycero-alpha-D-manno-heptose 1-phosphate guanylyltransferase
MKITEAIVLCGGFGTRLSSIVKDVPKPMAQVAGRPFLEILLNQLSAMGISRVILSTGYLASKIRNHFGNQFQNIQIEYCIDPEPLGTGGAAQASATLCRSETVLICNGDTYVEFDFATAEKLVNEKKSPLVITLKVEDTERYGRIKIDPENLAKYQGSGFSGEGYISGGVYIVPCDFLTREYPTHPPFSLENLIFDNSMTIEIFALEATSRFIDIGIPSDYAKAQSMFLKQ